MKRIYVLFGIIALLAMVLAACAAPATPTEPPSPSEATPTEGLPLAEELADTLYVFNWAAYMDETLLSQYEEEYGITIVYDTYDSNEDLLAKLQAGATGYDVIFPSDYMVSQMIELGLLAPLDFNNIPNFANVADLNKDPAYDPGNVYSVPYFWGTTGIGYDAEAVDPPPDSWAWLFDAATACQYADGGINILDDQREAMGSALKYLGYSVNDADEAHLMEARDILLAAKACWKTFDSSGYIDNLMIPGEIVLTQAWSGDVFVAAEENEVWTFVMPEEGGVIWQDNICIPATSSGIHKRTGEHFINWVLDAEIAAMNTNFVWYASPNEAAKAYINPEILGDPAIYPDEETMARLEWIEPLPTEVLAIYDRVWTEVKAQ
ncbi:MAG: spermidine/putrescine ABC transporter substrate-binding protein [Anaerolineae bacterium]|jgi:spermidine/putrescine transport system substrate-binding protein